MADHGHDGSTPLAWTVAVLILASILLAAGGMTFGPRVLLWVGVATAGALAVFSIAARVWSGHR